MVFTGPSSGAAWALAQVIDAYKDSRSWPSWCTGTSRTAPSYLSPNNAGNLHRMSAGAETDGLMTVMFTHISQEAWEALARSLIESGWIITSTMPVESEFAASMHQMGQAAAASSIFINCRKRNAADAASSMEAACSIELNHIPEVEDGENGTVLTSINIGPPARFAIILHGKSAKVAQVTLKIASSRIGRRCRRLDQARTCRGDLKKHAFPIGGLLTTPGGISHTGVIFNRVLFLFAKLRIGQFELSRGNSYGGKIGTAMLATRATAIVKRSR